MTSLLKREEEEEEISRIRKQKKEINIKKIKRVNE